MDGSNTSRTYSLVTFCPSTLWNLQYRSKVKPTVEDTTIPKVGYIYLSLAISVAEGQRMYLKVGPWVDGCAGATSRLVGAIFMMESREGHFT